MFGVGILFFSGVCYSILPLIICCEKRKECHRRCFCCVLFLLSKFIRFLFVLDLLLILFRIVLWPSVGKYCPLILNADLVVLVLTHLVFGAGCGTLLYRLLIIAFFVYFLQPTQAQGRRQLLKSGPAMGRRKRSPSAKSTRRGQHERGDSVEFHPPPPETILGSGRL